MQQDPFGGDEVARRVYEQLYGSKKPKAESGDGDGEVSFGEFAGSVLGGPVRGAAGLVQMTMRGVAPALWADAENAVMAAAEHVPGLTLGASADVEALGAEPGLQLADLGRFFGDTVPKAIGQAGAGAAAAVAGALAAPAAPVLGAAVGSAALFGPAGFADAYWEVKSDPNAGEDDALKAGLIGLGLGLTDVVPVLGRLKSVLKASPAARSKLMRLLLTPGRGTAALAEGGQELFQEAGMGLTKQAYTDKPVDWGGVLEAGGAGAVVGALLGVSSADIDKAGKAEKPAPKTTWKPVAAPSGSAAVKALGGEEVEAEGEVSPEFAWSREVLERRGVKTRFVRAGEAANAAVYEGGEAALNVDSKGGAAVENVALHELSHALKDRYGGSWGALAAEIARVDPEAIPEGVKTYLARAGERGKQMGEALRQEEGVAQVTEDVGQWVKQLLSDPRRFDRITQDRTFLQKFVDAIKDLANSFGARFETQKTALREAAAMLSKPDIATPQKMRAAQAIAKAFREMKAEPVRQDVAQPGAAGEGPRYAAGAWHGGPHKWEPERMIQLQDMTTKFIGMDEPLPEGAHVVREYPLGRVRLDKAGSGEGSAYRGWGFYAGEAMGTGEYYRTTTAGKGSHRQVIVDGVYENEVFSSRQDLIDGGLHELIYYMRMYRDPQRGIDEAIRLGGAAKEYAEKHKISFIPDDIPGALYELTIKPDDDQFLLWDEPVSQQSAKVREALQKAGVSMFKRNPSIDGEPVRVKFRNYSDFLRVKIKVTLTKYDGDVQKTVDSIRRDYEYSFVNPIYHQQRWYGQTRSGGRDEAERAIKVLLDSKVEMDVSGENDNTAGEEYMKLAERLGGGLLGKKAASELLLQHGIRGNKFLDQFSRQAGGGTYNYVMFSGEDVEVKARYAPPQEQLNPAASVNLDAPSHFARAMWNRLHRVLQLQRAVAEARGKATPVVETAEAADVTSQVYLGDLMREADGLARDLRDAGVTREDFDSYVYAKGAEDRNNYGIRKDPATFSHEERPYSGMTTSEARRIVAETEGGPKAEALKRLHARLLGTRDATLERRLRAGQITTKEAEAWKAAYGPNYVPLMDEEIAEGSPVRRRSLQESGPAVKRTKGRYTMADSPTAAVFMRAAQAIDAERRLRAGQAMDALLTETADAAFAEKLKPREGGKFEIPQGAEPADIWTTKIEGEEVKWWIKDPLTRRALKGVMDLDTDAKWPLLETMLAVPRVYKRLLTTDNPGFWARNLPRDVVQAAYVVGSRLGGEHTFKVLNPMRIGSALKTAWGVQSDATGEDIALFKQAQEDGAILTFTSGDFSMAGFRKAIDAASRGGNQSKLRAVKLLFDKIGTTVETATRFNVYKAALDAGKTRQEAAELAREASGNFSRRGEWSTGLNALYLFFNANVQVASTIFDTVNRNPKFAGIAGLSMFSAGFALAMLNSMLGPKDEEGEPEWFNYSDTDKAENVIVMLPWGGDVRLPLPTAASIMWQAGQAAYDLRQGRGTQEKVLRGVAATATDFVNALGKSRSAMHAVTPWFLDPMLTVQANRTQWGSRLMPDPWDKTKPESELFFRTASPSAVALSRYINSATGGNINKPGTVYGVDTSISPETLEHIVEFAGGGIGREATRVYRLVEKGLTGDRITGRDVPVLRTVVGGEDPAELRSVFYENIDRVQVEHNQAMDAETRQYAEARLAALYSAGQLARKRAKALEEQGNDAEARRVMLAFNKRVRAAAVAAKDAKR